MDLLPLALLSLASTCHRFLRLLGSPKMDVSYWCRIYCQHFVWPIGAPDLAPHNSWLEKYRASPTRSSHLSWFPGEQQHPMRPLNFSFEEVLGEGVTGLVFRAKRKMNGQSFALKRILKADVIRGRSVPLTPSLILS